MFLVGKPNDPTFDASATRAFEKLERCRKQTTFKPSESQHNRGHFVAINDGIYHGQGSKAPHRLNTGPHAPMLKELREDPDIKRLAAVASCEFLSTFQSLLVN